MRPSPHGGISPLTLVVICVRHPRGSRFLDECFAAVVCNWVDALQVHKAHQPEHRAPTISC